TGIALTQHLIMRYCRLGSDRGPGTHAYGNAQVTPDGLLNRTLTRQYAMNQGQILASHATLLQLSDKVGLSSFRASDNQQAGRIFVQPVYDTGTGHLTQSGK